MPGKVVSQTETHNEFNAEQQSLVISIFGPVGDQQSNVDTKLQSRLVNGMGINIHRAVLGIVAIYIAAQNLNQAFPCDLWAPESGCRIRHTGPTNAKYAGPDLVCRLH